MRLSTNSSLQDLFWSTTARSYSWATTNSDIAVEANTNAASLDNLALPSGRDTGSVTSPIVQLTAEQLRQHIILVAGGLVATGSNTSSALVFKCMWPSRFGSALLAAKVLRNTSPEPDQEALQSFQFEASVLRATE
jgi:hypothetical protein